MVFSYDDINAAGNGIKEVDPMPRHNHPKRSNTDTRHFDVVQIYEPDHADVRKFISMPRKTIFINAAASPTAKVLRVGWTRDDDLLRLPFEV